MGVRQEAVRLTLQDDFTTGMARAAAATALLSRNLHDLDGTSTDVNRNLGSTNRSLDRTSQSLRKTGDAGAAAALGLNRYSGRLGLIRDAVLGLGPAIIPLSASLLPALSAAFAGLGAAAGGIGVTVLAMQGLGDAVDAINKYRLQPTTNNLEKMQLAMSQLGPVAQDAAKYFANLQKPINELQEIAGQNLFPGLLDGLDALRERGPETQSVIAHLAAGMGELAREAGEGLAGPKFTAFFDYLETDARPTLEGFGRALGNITEGLANLVVAFAPLTRNFIGGLDEMTASFAEWSRGLEDNKSFQHFLSYIRESGPEVLDFLGSLIGALAAIVEAAAPFAAVMLPSLTAILDVLTAIADSDFGPAIYSGIAGLLVLNRVVKLTTGPLKAMNDIFTGLGSGGILSTFSALEKFQKVLRATAGVAGIGLFVTALHESNEALSAFELTAGAALTGFSVGKGWGAAIGLATGAVVALGRAHREASLDVDSLSASFDQQTGAITENTRVSVANDLQKQGYLDIANELGIAQGKLTDAVMGNADAQIYLNNVLDTFIQKGREGNRLGPTAQLAADALKLQGALPGLQGSFKDTAADANHLAGEIGSTATQLDEAAAAAKELEDALTSLDQFLSKRAAIRNYKEDLKNLSKTLTDTPGAFYKVQEAADAVVSDVNDFLKQVQDPKKQIPFLNDAIKQLKDFSKLSPAAAEAIAPLLNRLQHLKDLAKNLVPAKLIAETKPYDDAIAAARRGLNELDNDTAKPVFDADDEPFQRKIRKTNLQLTNFEETTSTADLDVDDHNSLNLISRIKQALDGLRDKTINVTVNQRGGVTSSAGGHSVPTPTADGGTVPGPRFPYADKTLMIAAPGEEVISNRYGQADRFRRDRAAGRIPGYADGGTVRPYMSHFDPGGPSHFIALGQAVSQVVSGLKALKAQLAEAEKALDREKQKRDEIASAMASLSSSVSSGLKSDLFGDQGSGWATSGGVGGVLATLTGDIGKGQQYTQLVAMLQSRGLHGGALQALLETNDVATLTQFANASADQLAQYQSLYDQRETVSGGAGGSAAQAIYGVQERAQLRELRGVRDEVRRLRAAVEKADKNNQKGHKDNAQDVAEGINSNFAAAHRRGQRGPR